MNVNAKQLNTIHVNHMDITTSLSFFMQMKGFIASQPSLVNVLGDVWTTFLVALDNFDEVYAQFRKWQQTAELKTLDSDRDKALRAFLDALKAFVSSPNAEKRQAALLVQNVRDKYHLATTDEYMKETYAIDQFMKELKNTPALVAAMALIGLTEYADDLEAKNDAFLAKMNERTMAQAGLETGVVREKRLVVENAYRDLVKLINALAIVEHPAGMDYDAPIDLLNAEIKHYQRIIGASGSSSSSSGSSSSNLSSEGEGSGENGGNTGDSGNSGNTGDSGDSGNSGNTGDSGNSGSGDNGGNSGSGDNGGDNGGGGSDWGNGSDE